MKDPLCPTCDAELFPEGTDESATFVFCHYCGSPLRVKFLNGEWEVGLEE